MKFWEFAYKNLLRGKVRSILTILSIAVTTTMLFVVFSLDKGFKATVKEELIEGIGAHLFIARGGCPMDAASIIAQGGISPMYIPEEVLVKIKDVKGIKVIMPFKIFAITLPDGTRTDIFCGITEEIRGIKPKWKIGKGGWFKDENSVILGAEIARLEKRQVGDKIYIEHFDKEFKVEGILDYAYNQDDGFFFLPLKTAQGLIRREGKLSAIALSVEDINKLDDIKITLKGLLPDDYMVLPPETIGQDVMNFFKSTRTIMYAMVFFTLLISAFGIANTMIMMIFERRKEFAYLRCVGAGRFDIYKLIIFETIILCLIGVVWGLICGVFSVNGFGEFIRKDLLSGYVSQKANIMRPGVDIGILSMLIVFVTALLAASYPAIKTTRIMPMEAIRNE